MISRPIFQPAHLPSSPPLYHTTSERTSQALQMLQFCYEIVTALLQKCYGTGRSPAPYFSRLLPALNHGPAPVYSIQAGKLEVAPRNQRRSWKLETPYELGAGKIASTDFQPEISCDIRPTHWNIKTRRKLKIRRSENSRQLWDCIQNTIFKYLTFAQISCIIIL